MAFVLSTPCGGKISYVQHQTIYRVKVKCFCTKLIYYLSNLFSSHWDKVKESRGEQCVTCGKVFGSGNRNAYLKHLATHDDDSQ